MPAGEACRTGLAYCVALAAFGTRDDADPLTARPGADRAARFLAEDGLWQQWVQGTPAGGRSSHPAPS
ncbi:DUF6000 family protein [Streptomyces sp. NPDC020731]|uniref:DUF6000 family protein n=1 Tax=Streptomyces sp. NPDC020731 TaxID=3365085 RepID=UPI0037A33FAF